MQSLVQEQFKHNFLLTTDRLEPKEQYIDEDLMCMICTEISQEPVECETCQTMFCKQCVTNWLNKKSRICPSGCVKSSLIKPHKKFLQQLYKLSFACENINKGCDVKVTFESVKIHQLSECLFRVIEKDQKEEVDIVVSQEIIQNNLAAAEYIWFWRDPDLHKWVRYPEEQQKYFEQQMLQQLTEFTFELNKATYQIDRKEARGFIVQRNIKTGYTRQVIRLDLNMAYKGTFWFCQINHHFLQLYSIENTQLIEEKYIQYLKGNFKATFHLEVSQITYEVSLNKLNQMNLQTGMTRAIERLKI